MEVFELDGVEEDGAHPSSKGWSLEAALAHIGTGPFHWMALAVCGCANAADAVEILSMSLIIPASERDLQLSTKDKGAISSCIFLGMLIGGLTWGVLGDHIGRRRSLFLALLLNAAFGALSAAAKHAVDLVFLRLAAGIGVGGSVPVVFALLAELLPVGARGRYMVGLAAHWMVGSIFSAGAGWVLIPRLGWRVYALVASIPAWMGAAGTLLLMPESPRYLLVQGQEQQALQVLAKIGAMNGRRLPPAARLLSVEGHGQRSAAQGSGSSNTARHAACAEQVTGSASRHGRLHTALKSAAPAFKTMAQLLRPPLLQCTLPLLGAWIGMCGGWYSLVLWIPTFFQRRGAGSTSLYAETFAVACANLPGNVASIFMVDWLGRRLTACICLAGACIFALFFALAPATGAWAIVAACMFNAISVGGWNALDLVSAELYPTSVRSSGMGLLGAVGRLASFTTTFMAGALMEVRLWAPLVVAAALLAVGSGCMMLLPEPAGHPLEDTVHAAKLSPADSNELEPEADTSDVSASHGLGARHAEEVTGLLHAATTRSA